MKAIWKGSINFALVSIRVKLYTATRRKEISFKLLHKPDNAPIEYKRRCPLDSKDLSWREIVRGYEYRKRKYVVITGDEFKALPQFASKSINIEAFVGAGEIPSIYYDKVYYLEPDAGSERPCGLLREALKETGKTALAPAGPKVVSLMDALRKSLEKKEKSSGEAKLRAGAAGEAGPKTKKPDPGGALTENKKTTVTAARWPTPKEALKHYEQSISSCQRHPR